MAHPSAARQLRSDPLGPGAACVVLPWSIICILSMKERTEIGRGMSRIQRVIWERMSRAAWNKAVFPPSYFDEERLLKVEVNDLAIEQLLYELTRQTYLTEYAQLQKVEWRHEEGDSTSRIWHVFFVFLDGSEKYEYRIELGQTLEESLNDRLAHTQQYVDKHNANEPMKHGGPYMLAKSQNELRRHQYLLALVKSQAKLRQQLVGSMQSSVLAAQQQQIDRMLAKDNEENAAIGSQLTSILGFGEDVANAKGHSLFETDHGRGEMLRNVTIAGCPIVSKADGRYHDQLRSVDESETTAPDRVPGAADETMPADAPDERVGATWSASFGRPRRVKVPGFPDSGASTTASAAALKRCMKAVEHMAINVSAVSRLAQAAHLS
ncbi:hypothetical protein LTR85_009013 [Meristemomyces frigidus]|nr:hypothetical protein LTR85_009013 [Meristemomyces frigidus]